MRRAFDRATSARACRAVAGGLVVVGGLAGLAGCGGDDDAPAIPVAVRGTVPLGELPEPLSNIPPPEPPPNAPSTTTSTTEPEIRLDGPIGGFVDGNRVLVIGDGVLATTEPSSRGIVCDVLNDLGWSVEIAADSGRAIEFGRQVLDARFDPGGGDDVDVAIVMLGNLFDGDLDAYTGQLTEIVERLEPRPVVLFTLTELDDETEPNEAMRAIADQYAQVRLVDWAEFSAAETELLLRSGGPIPTTEGSGRLVIFMAGELGDAPVGMVTECTELELEIE